MTEKIDMTRIRPEVGPGESRPTRNSAGTSTSPRSMDRFPAMRLCARLGTPRWRTILAGALNWCIWIYGVTVFLVWLMLHFAGDRWWLATMMLYGPRWVYGLPLAILVPAAAIGRRRRLLWLLAASVVVVIWPIMGLCLPLGRLARPDGVHLRVLTFNVDGNAVNGKALAELVEKEQPDVVALQECAGDDRYQWPGGWHVLRHGELLVASRYPIREVNSVSGKRTGHVWPRPSLLHCILTLPGGEVDFGCVHLPSPRWGLTGVLDRRTLLAPSRSALIGEENGERRRQSEEAAALVEDVAGPLILAGDFNLPGDSQVYRRSWGRYRDAFSTSGFGFGNTMRPRVRRLPFGIRIDHVLTSPHWRPRRCWVGPDIGPKHLPLIAELVQRPRSGEP